MRFFSFLLSLFTVTAFAQDGVARGDALRRREFQTYATVSLFVDPTGSDTNACTSSGASACATLTGALAKVPFNIRHDVTIAIAAGTYTDQAIIGPFSFSGTASSTGPTLSINGTLGLATVTSGSNAGAISAFTDEPDTGTAPGTLTDSSQTWTTNDLRGRFLRITSGVNNNAVRPIISNTATTITFIGAFATDPAVAETYSIVTPASIFSTGLIGISGLSGRGNFSMGNVDLQQTSTVAFTLDGNTNRSLTLGGGSGGTMRITQTSTSSAMTLGSTRLTTSAVAALYIEGGIPVNHQGGTAAMFSVINMGTAYIRSTSTAASNPAYIGSNGVFNVNSTGTVYFEQISTASASTPAMDIVGTIWVNPSPRTALMVNCNGAGAGAMAVNTFTARVMRTVRLDLYNTAFFNCPTAFDVRNGATVNVASGGTTTFSTVTNEVRLDNTTTYTYSTVNGFSPKLVKSPLGTTFTISQP